MSDEVQVGKVCEGPDGQRYWVAEPEPILFDVAERLFGFDLHLYSWQEMMLSRALAPRPFDHVIISGIT